MNRLRCRTWVGHSDSLQSSCPSCYCIAYKGVEGYGVGSSLPERLALCGPVREDDVGLPSPHRPNICSHRFSVRTGTHSCLFGPLPYSSDCIEPAFSLSVAAHHSCSSAVQRHRALSSSGRLPEANYPFTSPLCLQMLYSEKGCLENCSE